MFLFVCLFVFGTSQNNKNYMGNYINKGAKLLHGLFSNYLFKYRESPYHHVLIWFVENGETRDSLKNLVICYTPKPSYLSNILHSQCNMETKRTKRMLY